MKILKNAVVGIVLGTFGAGSAWAYIPPSRYVIEKWAKKHEKIKHALIVSRVVRVKDSELTGEAFVERTLYRSATKSLQSQVVDADGNVMFSKSRSLTIPGIEKQPPPPAQPRRRKKKDTTADGTPAEEDVRPVYPFYPDYKYDWETISQLSDVPLISFLLFDDYPQEVSASLRRYDLPIVVSSDLADTQTVAERRIREQMHLRRLDNRYAWVIGSAVEKKTDSTEVAAISSPQLWIEKDTFMPLRLFMPNQSARSEIDFEGLAEIRFENYRYSKTFPYPHQISIYSGGKEILRSTIERIEVDEKVDPAKFTKNDGFTPQGQSKLGGSTRSLIELYYSFLR